MTTRTTKNTIGYEVQIDEDRKVTVVYFEDYDDFGILFFNKLNKKGEEHTRIFVSKEAFTSLNVLWKRFHELGYV